MFDLSNLTILIVEDDPDARELMQAVLEQRGATVQPAESVARAFQYLETSRPDVIISDIAMPEEDGVTLVRRLRALPPDLGGRTPAIAVSAYVASSDRARALAAGFERYLHKPIDFDQLIDAIRDVLEGDQQAIA
jgi:CheY-like chemotaxis protein